MVAREQEDQQETKEKQREETDAERKNRLQAGVLRRQVLLNAVLDVDFEIPGLVSYEKDADIDG